MPGTPGPNLGLVTGWQQDEDGWGEEGFNPNFDKLDALVHLSVLSATQAAPPASPAHGDRYIVPAAASGAWANHGTHIAVYREGVWAFYEPQRGFRADVQDQAPIPFSVFDGTAWAPEPGIADAPNDGQGYVRREGEWVPAPTGGDGAGIGEAPEDGNLYGRRDGSWEQIEHPETSGIEEAPEDGQGYIRMDGGWVAAPTPGDGGNGVEEAPEDGTPYSRQDGTWVPSPTGGGGDGGNAVEEAPEDGKPYARQDGGWVEISTGDGGDGNDDAPFTARTWRIAITASAGGSNFGTRIAAFDLLDAGGNRIDMSAATVTGSAPLSTANSAQMAVDGDDQTWFRSNASPSAISPIFLQVEFPGAVKVSAVRLVVQENVGGAPRDFTVFGDGVVLLSLAQVADWALGVPKVYRVYGGSFFVQDAPKDDKTYSRRNGQWVEATVAASAPFDVGLFIPGVVPAANALLSRYVFTRAVAFAANLTGSVGYAGTPPTAGTTLDLRKNGTSIGTVTFAAGASTATFTTAAAVSFAAGDRLSVYAPAAVDAALADISVTLAGTRS